MLTYISFTDSVDSFMYLYKETSMPDSNDSLVTALTSYRSNRLFPLESNKNKIHPKT
jgi:hypothetical protein